MEGVIGANVPLDYAEFHITPSQNRYQTKVYSGSIVETLASGILEQLSQYLPKANDLYLKGSNINFKLHPPGNPGDAKWFTKSTLTRFLHMVASVDILNITNTIGNEISLLEESRKFHLSLYAKGHQDQFGSGKADGKNGSGGPESDITPSDESKNELLQAMDLRLSALRGELSSAFSRAAGATCSPKEISDLERFSQYFGATELRNFLCKFMELSKRSHAIDFPSNDKFLSTHDSSSYTVSKTERSSDISKPSHSDTPVKFGVSPAKVAQVERESSTEGEESSHSSEEGPQFGERSSRTLIRSASPRRSASPMRRIQIGRSGSRRTTALTIKSLSYFPAREKMFAHTDAESDEEGSEQPAKKPESHIRRMSVQDAISLFESKQRDQAEDTQKRSSILDTSVTANKSVLRRWSSGIVEGSTQSLPENVSESSVQMSPKNSGVEENPKSSIEEKPEWAESDLVSGGENSVATVSVKVDTSEKNSEKLTASAEWTQQKEAELNQMLMKMMESKPVRYQNAIPDSCKNQNVPSEQRGGFYNHYKEKRDEKLRGETAGKKSEKEAQFRAMQKIINERKSEMASSNVTDAGKKQTPGKPAKQSKTLSQSANSKKETSKPAVTKKTVSKASPLPPTRKSWPSTPPARSTGISPAKTPSGISSAGTTPTRRKPQPAGPAPSVTRSNPKVERTQQRPKSVKPTQNDLNKSTKGMNEKKQAVPKNGKTAKTKEQNPSGDLSSTGPTKPSFYSKVTKKSSVVPLESKPFLRKGSGIGPGVGPTVLKTKVSSQPEESLRTSGDLTQAQENEMVINNSVPVSQPEEIVLEGLESHVHLESETQLDSNEQNYADTESSDQVTANGDDNFKRMSEELSLKTVAEEESVIISPSAWVEIEEHQDPHVPSPSNIAPVAISSPRVRHSLSQMLLEESSETDIIEWGNAENPPSIVYQKDSPKGFKRLLKFARKSRADANTTGWSSPSAFSEGEDDAEESKAFGRKNGDNLLRKATLHAKNYGQQKTSSFEGYEKSSASHELLSAQSNIGKFTSHKLQEGHVSASATTNKATRSFFSLSAFRGSK